MSPEELSKLPLEVEKLFYDLQNRIMSDVVRRIQKMGEITSTADYQLNRYEIIGNSTEFIESEIKRLTGLADAQLWELYDEVIEKEYTRKAALYEQINATFIPPEDNIWLKTLGNAIIAQTASEIQNISKSLGFSLDYGNGRKVFAPLSEYYQRYIDSACIDIVSGAFDYNSVLRRTVKQMTASGLQYVDYANGYRCRAPVAARRAVMTGAHQLSNKINEQAARDIGTDDYETTAHYGARIEHSYWQGGVYSYKELATVCGLNSVTGLCGANCRHSYHPFVKGISVPAYTKEYLDDIRSKDAEVHNFKGKNYNAYEASQKQRHYETTMRSQRARVKLLKDGKADQDDILTAQTRYVQTLHEYQRFSKAMKIPTQMERVYMDGLGRIAPGVSSKSFQNSAKSGKIKIHRNKMVAGKYPTSDAAIKDVLSNELSGVNMISTPRYNGRIRSQGITKYQEYPWGEFKKITGIEISKQVKNTRECLIDTILHEQLEAKIVSLKDKNDFYRKLYSCSEEDRHIYINRVIKRFFKGKGWNYGLV